MASWKLSSLPKFIEPHQVQRELDCCDLQIPQGRRNYAILLLLARLGLRAGEVVALTLDDIQWETNELILRGKGRHIARLPLPQDVGQAIAEYLKNGRPPCSTRRLFVRLRAPREGFANSSTLSTLVQRALKQAGLNPPRKGAHLFRLTAIRSFFKYAAFQEPGLSAHIQCILAIPTKRHDRALIDFLVRPEIKALLSAPDSTTWAGRRDYALLRLAIQTGLRLSELIHLQREDVTLGAGANVRCHGKGRKERCTPLTKQTAAVLRTWMEEQGGSLNYILFPNARGGLFSPDGVQYLLTKHVRTAKRTCPSLRTKRVTPHVLCHTCAMELLQAGVDRSVIALGLGHESIETTHIYLDANLSLKENVLSLITPLQVKMRRYRPDDKLLHFLQTL